MMVIITNKLIDWLKYKGFLNTTVPYTLYAIALKSVNAGVSSIIAGFSPIVAQALVMVLYRHSSNLTLSKAAGFFIAGCGLTFVSMEKVITSSDFNWNAIGNYVYLILGTISKGAASVYGQHNLNRLPVLTVAWGQTMYGAIVSMCSALLVDFVYNNPPYDFKNTTTSSLTGLVYLALLSSCVVYILQFFLLQNFGSVKQTLVEFLVPIIGLVEAVLFRGGWSHTKTSVIAIEVIGCAMLMIGLRLVMGPNLEQEQFQQQHLQQQQLTESVADEEKEEEEEEEDANDDDNGIQNQRQERDKLIQ